MFSKIKNNQTLKTIFDTQNIGLYALFLVALSVTWSSIRIIQKNYEIEKNITVLSQEVAVLQQQTENQKLINQYFKTDAYLNLAARRYFSKAAPGEKVIIVPGEIAQTYIKKAPEPTPEPENALKNSSLLNNFKAWGKFLSGEREAR